MAEHTSAGTKLYIGGSSVENPALDGTYQEIGEVVNIGEFGRTYAEVTHINLSDRNVKKHKGSRNDGTFTVQLAKDMDDDGQDDLRAALDIDLDFNFQLTENDDPGGTGNSGTITYFKAKVMSFTTNVGGADQIVGASVSLGIKSGSIVEVPAS